MSRFRPLLRIGLLLSLLIWSVGLAAAAETVASPFHVAGSKEWAELRISPTGGRPPRTAVRAGQLVLTFARDPLPRVGDLESRLQQFVAGIGSDPATRQLRFLLRSGTEVAIAKGKDGGLRVTFHRKAEALAAIGVRIGRHPDFLRLVFEGPEAARARLQRGDGRIGLRFARPLGSKVKRRLEALKPLAGVKRPRADSVLLRLAEGYGAKVLRLPPDRLVLDLTAEAPPAPAAETTRVEPRRSGESAPRQTGEAATSTQGARGAEDARAEAGKRDAEPMAAKAPEGVAAEVTTAGSETRIEGTETAGKPGSEALPAVADRTAPPASSATASSAAEAAGQPADAHPAPVADAVPATVAILEIRAAREDDTVVLRFLWPFEVGAAAFIRGGRLWVVFDAATRSLLVEKKKIAFHAGALIRSLRQEAHDRATVLRIDLRRTVPVSMRREGNVWVLRFGKSGASAIAPQPRAEPGGLLFPGARRSIRFRDSIAGDEMGVLTYASGNTGLPQPRRLVDLALLESAQGIAWRAIAADVDSRRVPGGILLTRPGGLRLDADAPAGTPRPEPPYTPDAGSEPPRGSSTADEASATTGKKAAPEPPATTAGREAAAEPSAAGEAGGQTAAPSSEGSTAPAHGRETGKTQAASAASAPETGLRDPAWKTTFGLAELPPEVLRETDRLRRALLAELVRRADPERAPLRLRIARLYLADALGAEAFAQLLATSGIASVNGDPLLTKRRAALAGASSLLLGRNAVAAEHFRSPLLTDDRETSLWRAVLAAGENRWDVAAKELARSGEILRSYPPALRFRLGLVAVMIAAQNGDATTAFDWLKQLDELELAPHQRDELRFVEALTLSRDGANGEARRLLARLAEEADWLTATKAQYALVNLDRDAGRIDDDTARQAFLRQRPFWRGHPWEPTMLREFGRLERSLNHVPEALAVWRELLGRYPDSPATAGVAKEMAGALAEALAPGARPALPLFVRLELYRRYIALLPTGETGDRITLDLANGLLETGLPELAEKLASERLPVATGESQRRALANLRARAALAAGSPERARELAAKLAATGRGAEALRARLLMARAQLEEGNPRGALTTLEGISDPRALAIRIDAHWEAREWEALASLAAPLATEIASRKKLSEEEAVRALRVGAALARAGQRERVLEIARLVAARSSLATVQTLFELMTTPVGLTGDAAAVAAGISQLTDRLRTSLAYLQAGDGSLAPAAAAGAF